jgi:hypothetical protein
MSTSRGSVYIPKAMQDDGLKRCEGVAREGLCVGRTGAVGLEAPVPGEMLPTHLFHPQISKGALCLVFQGRNSLY